MRRETARRAVRARRAGVVVVILCRHLLGYVLTVLHVDRFVPFHRGLLGHTRRDAPYTRAEHVRLAVEELGAASIKIGQIISTRGDLLPPAYQFELAKLQDAAPPEPESVIEAVVAAELHRSVERAFGAFDARPIAAASIGQVHTATLHDGTEVVVKVRRPNVARQVEVDLDIMQHVVRQAMRVSRVARRLDIERVSAEFAATLRSELDYGREAANIERFAENFCDDPTIRIPRVYRRLSTRRVLTLERLRGLKVDDLAGLDAAGIDRVKLAQDATTAMLRMIFEHGFFHADPHPGNFFIERDGRIGLIDFGMVGTVDAATRNALRAVLLTLVEGRSAQLAEAIADLGMTTARTDRDAIAGDLDRLMAAYLLQPLGQVALGRLLYDVLGVVRRHRLRLPANLALLAKTFAMCEGIAAQLDPSFQMAAALAPYLPRLLERDVRPAPVADAPGGSPH